MPSYKPKEIEEKWQKYWLDHKVFQSVDSDPRPKYYILDMFPYPSGAGLHVGHLEGYTATDILARYQRMRGSNVLHPMGWDAFGLPAEQYAVQTGTHPADTTGKNIENFRRQIRMLGFSYDWDREIDTTDPKYYSWTQWIFLQMHDTWYDPKADRGRPISLLPIPGEIRQQGEEATNMYRDSHRLAYLADTPVNWCQKLGTVLANEEVTGGLSERGGHPVVQLPLRQWMLRITSYAERLLGDLEGLDWPEPIKKMQRQWIGRSEGAEVDFPILSGGSSTTTSLVNDENIDRWFEERKASGYPAQPEGMTIRVFTTRPDTLFGATYLVLAPEHPLVEKITTADRKQDVGDYRKKAARKSDLDRTDLAKQKSGVFTGAYAINPVDNETIPIWIADYVLMGYGTGAIMAVPAHDERDFEFAKKFGLEIAEVVVDPSVESKVLLKAHEWLGDWERQSDRSTDEKYLRVAILINCGFDIENFEKDIPRNQADPLWAEVRCFCKEGQQGLAVSFLEDDFKDLLLEYVAEENDTQIYVLSLEPEDGDLEEEDELDHSYQPESADEDLDFEIDEDELEEILEEEFEFEENLQAFIGEGVNINSGLITGLPTPKAKKVITDWLDEHGLGKGTVNHKLRDWLFSRQRYWGEPFPILLDEEGNPHAIDESELPLALPQLEDFEPTGTPDPPLSKAGDWLTVERNGKKYRRETNTMPQWAGSCWYYLRYIDPGNEESLCDRGKEKYWMPVDLYVGGAEHAVLHLLYARFWHKVLYDLGHVHTPEPFGRLVNQGMILGELEYLGYRTEDRWVDADEVTDAEEGLGKVQKSTAEPVEAVALESGQVEKNGDRWVLTEDKKIRIDARAFKMSKSRGNVINPDRVVEDYGADALRLYEMFMGPLCASKPWNMAGVEGVFRFLNRAWRLIVDSDAEEVRLAGAVSDSEPTREQLRMLHQTIRGVTADIEAMRFNTAISKLMELVNFLSQQKDRPKAILQPLVLMLSPFAPHIGEELWKIFGHGPTLTREPWPEYDEALCAAGEIEVAVQINNKVRAKLTVAADLSDEELIELARQDEKIKSLSENKKILKSFVVSSRKGKLVNFVMK